MIRSVLFGLLAISVLAGCTRPLYHWGQYEESLHTRVTDTSLEGRQKAFVMLEATILSAEQTGQRVPPGIHADYGYLLYRANRMNEAVLHFRKEAALYPESRMLMESVISRVAQRQQP